MAWDKRLLFLILIAGMLLVGTVYAIAPPVADFTVDQTDSCLGDTITFTDLSANYPDSWLWDFGDGNTSTDQNPVYIYGYAGTFTVTLNATNPAGSDELEKIEYISVLDCGPDAAITANSTCHIGLPVTVQFDSVCNSTQYKSEWDFGDGNSTSDAQNASHTYEYFGAFTVTHTCGAPGDIAIDTTYIAVAPDGAICPGDAVCVVSGGSGGGGSSSTHDRWDMMWLIYGIVGGIVGVTFLHKK
jgi:PKD repeat protein